MSEIRVQLAPDVVTRLRQRATLPPIVRALRALRAVERRRLVAAASRCDFGIAAKPPPAKPSKLSPEQLSIIASAISANHLDELRADVDHHRVGLHASLGEYADELAASIDPSIVARRRARLRADALSARLFGGAAA